MSFVVAVPDLVQTAAQDLAGIRSALDEVSEAVAAPTISLAPAAGDEISAAVAALFCNFGEQFQVLYAQAAAFLQAVPADFDGGRERVRLHRCQRRPDMAAATPAPGLDLGGGLGGGLRGLQANLSGGLPGLRGVTVNVRVSNGLVGGLSRLVQTGESRVANLGGGLPGLTLPGLPGLSSPGLSLPNLGADLSAIINAALALPRLALDVFAGLPGLSLPGLTVPGIDSDPAGPDATWGEVDLGPPLHQPGGLRVPR